MKHDSDILKRIKSYFMRRRSADEAYRFERQIERDPFLYEAVEGFEDMLTSDIQQAMDELDDRLDEKTKNRRLIFSWQIAATVLVIVGGVAIFAMLGDHQSTNESPNVSSSEDSYQPRSDAPRFNQMDELPQEQVAEGDSEAVDPDPVQDQVDQQVDIPIAVVEDNKAKTLDEEANRQDKAKKERLSEPMNDSGIAATQSEPTQAKTATEAELAMELDDATTGSAEVERKAEESMEKSNVNAVTKAPSESSNTKKAVPAGGMNSYQSYLKNSLQRSPGMPSGSVVLSFEFDRDGTPKKIEVQKSLCTACDAEAKRLIEEGPKWNMEDRKERTSITVNF